MIAYGQERWSYSYQKIGLWRRMWARDGVVHRTSGELTYKMGRLRFTEKSMSNLRATLRAPLQERVYV